MDYDTLDAAILAGALAGRSWEHWSTGLRIDVLDGGNEKSYFVKVIEREDFVGMAEAEYEGQKAIAAVIPDNAVKPVAWGYYADAKTKAWFMAEYSNFRARAPPLEQLLPIVKQMLKQMHQRSISPTGQFGFHVTSYYGPQPMIVDWTDNWEEFWVREFRSGLRNVERMRGQDPELFEIAEQFIEKVASRLLRPLQKVKVGASKPIEDFEDRVSLYAMAKADIKRLLEKYPDGLRYYMGGLEPTIASLPDTPPATPSRAQPPTQIASKGDNTGINTPPRTPLITYDPSRNSITDDLLAAGE
ncbi:fructosamine Kinase PKL/CAK/FruK [Beauveria bassiana ARSEF 2860]|uniref:protein-ribulosamine 3-kinase n=1 Tax=Beauveria bassiana (strain ARSEF 2860) TaxID=655819 RepID=J4KRA1_BEAB2|nr:fructosamine Kinase PKL/CAK/FruK [Beauveria bassiana ARSEF 2860]EJP70594.1 fructosamine Kinase PKL/CAK/FruK [Beauveria bassiana ARSEF 2860]